MISDKAVIETSDIGSNVIFSEFCVVRNNVKIGNNVVIHPNVIIYESVEIGDDVEIFPGSFIGKKPKATNALSRDTNYKQIVKIGKGSSIGVNATIYYDVKIGDNTLIGDGAIIREQSVIGNSCVIGQLTSLNYNVEIGNNSKLMAYTRISGNCKIGNNVFIGVGVIAPNDNNIANRQYSASETKSAMIEDNVSIGSGAIILPNLKIGNGSLIGAGAVVTNDVEENSQVMGMPARHIKYTK